jgi:branched-chain amino acid aminotransferase
MGEVIQGDAGASALQRRSATLQVAAGPHTGSNPPVSLFWCNGEFHEGAITLSPGDRGLSHGLGVFETMLALDGRMVALDLHLERMSSGSAKLGLDPARVDFPIIKAAAGELLIRCGLGKGRARIRISLTSGSGDQRIIAPGNDSLLWIMAAPAAEPAAAVSLVTATFPRNENSPLAGIKCLCYAENLIALDHARRQGADECLFFNTRGEVCEATTSNVFLVLDGQVVTPPLSSGCLGGTMRLRVMEICRDLGIRVGEATLGREDLFNATEVFTTSAIRGVVPVSSLDGRLLTEALLARRLASACFAPAGQASNR